MINTLRSMKRDEQFDSIFELVKKAANPIKLVGQPTLQMNEKSQIGNIPQLFPANLFPSS